MIPKIIHYCWFGKEEIPEHLQKCIMSWEKKMPDYEIIRWDESNCSFDECEFVQKAYRENKYAFISDYYRLKALYDYGGIYLDTDVVVHKRFDDLLRYPCFLSFNYDCCIGTAVIGSEKNNSFIREILDLYNRTVFSENKSADPLKQLIQEGDSILVNGFETNNYYFTWHIIQKYPEVRLNNIKKLYEKFMIFPKEDFEIGRVLGGHYTIHLNDGSWRTNKKSSSIKDIVKRLLSHSNSLYIIIQILVRQRRYKIINKNIPFYEYSIRQKKQ